MFSGCQDCSIKLSVQWQELLIEEFEESDTVRVHGLEWFLHAHYLDGDDDVFVLAAGFKQTSEPPVSCATHIRYIVDSGNPNGARYTVTRGAVAVCGVQGKGAPHFSREFVEEHLLNDGWLTVIAELAIFKPIQFAAVPVPQRYSFSDPLVDLPPLPTWSCLYPVAERNGLVYLLAKHRNTKKKEIEKWSIQCIKTFEWQAVTLETKEIGVTQLDKQAERIQLDVVGLEGGVETRIYPLPESKIRFRWSEAVRTSKGWMMSARGTRHGRVCFQFWLLADEMTLFLELRRARRRGFGLKLQCITYNSLYCILMSPSYRQLMFVCDFEVPSVWREYEMCPEPAVRIERRLTRQLFAAWPQPVLAACIEARQGTRRALFKLIFTTTLCLLVPFLALPQSLNMYSEDRICFNSETLVAAGATLTVLPLIPLN